MLTLIAPAKRPGSGPAFVNFKSPFTELRRLTLHDRIGTGIHSIIDCQLIQIGLHVLGATGNKSDFGKYANGDFALGLTAADLLFIRQRHPVRSLTHIDHAAGASAQPNNQRHYGGDNPHSFEKSHGSS
uniref:Uncharacterized protein n=1 Tax=mine drainage metagenome TaxID=410659 RepID=E6QNG1_9ZZZZ